MPRRRRAAEMAAKPWYTSKLNLVNLISFFAVLLEATPFLDVVPDHHEKYVALAVFALNLILRTFYTDTPTDLGVRMGTAKRAPSEVPPRHPPLSVEDQQAVALAVDGLIDAVGAGRATALIGGVEAAARRKRTAYPEVWGV